MSAQITVLYFAAASTATGISEEQIEIPEEGCSLSRLKEVLVSKYPETNLKEVLETSEWSVNAEMVENASIVRLKGGEEVAVICPVSGG